MDLREVAKQLKYAETLLRDKVPAPLVEGTAAFQTILTIEMLIRELNNSLGQTHKAEKPER